MKILLVAVNAKYIHSNPAIYSLRAFAQEFAEQVELLELTINHYTEDILREIYVRQPDMVAFSCYIWNLAMVEEALEELPKILPSAELWAGGPEVSYDAADFLWRHPQMRGVMVGEGEETFRDLAAHYAEKAGALPFSEIAGITWRTDRGEIVENPARTLLSMDRIPFLYRDMDVFEHRIVYYESSRGCPFSCSYCLSSIDKQVRFRSASLVTEELQFFLDHRIPQVKFVDRTFNCSHRHALTIWNYIKEHDNGVTNFHFEIAADLLNEEELTLLNSMRPGLVQLEIGVQSTNSQTICEIDRVMNFEHLKTVAARVQSGHNIHQHLDLIAGLPHEDYESFTRSFDDVYRLHPDQLQLGFLKVLKGSKMHRKAAEYGIVYHSRPVYEVLNTRWISYGELLRLKAVEEVLEVYYNSGQFAHTMRRLEQEFERPFAMYDALAQYYERQGLNGKNHARPARFEILLSFIREKTDDPVYRELLTLDLYLREKSKSRPAWAAGEPAEGWRRTADESAQKCAGESDGKRVSGAAYKQLLLEFYQREEQERKLLPDYRAYSAKQMMHMTHLERFSHDVLGSGEPGEHWLLFDYLRRDPLSGDAAVTEVFL